ncbi:MAG: hypothetical protein KC416_08870, partial [Myxococcales bacterium]|nr:hypothetical protein [Myxococcales bacterium]
MTSPSSSPTVVSDLVEVLRRSGVAVGPGQIIDAHRAVLALGLDRRADVKAALRCTLARDRASVPLFDRVFDAFFALGDASLPGNALQEGASALADLETRILAQLEAEGSLGGSPAGTDAFRVLGQGGAAVD